MTLSRQEINLRRLLTKSELMVKTNRSDERFPKYITSLDDMLKELHSISEVNTKPKEDKLIDYKKRILTVKLQLGLINEDDVFTEMKVDDNADISNRDELLGVRQRNIPAAKDLDQVIDYHQDLQGKIAEDMLEMTKSLKEQSKLAGQIIKRDTEVVSRSAQMSEANYTKLKNESEKLSDHSKRACKCWMWVMLVIVMVVFVNMVFFMKIMKKT